MDFLSTHQPGLDQSESELSILHNAGFRIGSFSDMKPQMIVLDNQILASARIRGASIRVLCSE